RFPSRGCRPRVRDPRRSPAASGEWPLRDPPAQRRRSPRHRAWIRAGSWSSRRDGNTIRLVCPANSLTAASMAREEDYVGGEVESIGVAEARSALAWWLEAGVDIAVQEQPRDWLKPALPRAEPAAEPPSVSNVAEPDAETLAALQSWLASSAQVPLASLSNKRILPHGPENAPLMLLSDGPTLEDAA